jgi:hypothetical protein
MQALDGFELPAVEIMTSVLCFLTLTGRQGGEEGREESGSAAICDKVIGLRV